MKTQTRFPSIKEVANDLRYENRYFHDNLPTLDEWGEEELLQPVRLQVYPTGEWFVHAGLSDYDQDHRGYWGSSYLTGKRFNSYQLARELLDQAKEHASQCDEDDEDEEN